MQEHAKNNVEPNRRAFPKKVPIAFFLFWLLLFGTGVFGQQTLCQNQVCDAGENSCNCPSDCGTCGGPVLDTACKEYACVEGICRPKQIDLCCGNTLCETGESFGDCPADCEPTSLELDVSSPKGQERFFLGDTVSFIVNASSSGRPVSTADLNVTGFFGVLKLFNDGKHQDNREFDSVFGNQWTVSDVNAGTYDVYVNGFFRGIETSIRVPIQVETRLDVVMDPQASLKRGNILLIRGKITKHGIPVVLPVSVSLKEKSTTLFSSVSTTDQNGFFEFSYPSSLIDPIGTWDLSISGKDFNGNQANVEQLIKVRSENSKDELFVRIGKELPSSLSRGSTLEVFAEVLTDQNQAAAGATVSIESPLLESFPMTEVQPGIYSAQVPISIRFPLGEQAFRISARLDANGSSAIGSLLSIVPIEKAPLTIKILEPSAKYYRIGEKMPVLLSVTYRNGDPVTGGRVFFRHLDQEISLEPVDEGLYQTEVMLTDSDRGELALAFLAMDEYENESFEQTAITVATRSTFSELAENPLLALGIIAVLSVIGFLVTGFFGKIFSSYDLKGQKEKLLAQKALLEQKYFSETSIGKEAYQKRVREITDRIEKIDEQLERMKK